LFYYFNTTILVLVMASHCFFHCFYGWMGCSRSSVYNRRVCYVYLYFIGMLF